MTTVEIRQTGPKLTEHQRDVLVGWLKSGITDYTAIRQLLIEHGFPVVRRQAVHWYIKRYGLKSTSPLCHACGQSLPA
jgi:hypothetical protein